MSWRVVAHGPKPELTLPTAEGGGSPRKGERDIYLPEERRYGQVPVFDRYALSAGWAFDGPAVIEERESTVVVNGRARITADAIGNLVVDLPRAAA